MTAKKTPLITIQNCSIQTQKETLIPELSWKMNAGEAWLVIGPNGGGKADFINALAGVSAGSKTTSGAFFVKNYSMGDNNSVADNNSTTDNNSQNKIYQTSIYSNPFENSTELVSLERAARLIQEERENDESEYIEGGVDIGRTGRVFITEGLIGKFKKTQLNQITQKQICHHKRLPLTANLQSNFAAWKTFLTAA